MELMPGYKQTEVGVIPEDWEIKNLGELARFRTGPFGSALHKEDYTNNGIPIVNPMHIVDGKIVATQEMTITAQRASELADFRLRQGDIVIGRRGEMGRCSVVKADQEGWLCGTGSMIIRTSPLASAYFLQLVLSSPPIVAAIENASVGSTMINLNQSVLAGLIVALPGSKEEQETISSSIEAVGAQVEALQALITKKQQIKQAAMQELLTGKRRLPGFEGEWEMKRIGEVATPFSEKNACGQSLPVLTCSKHVGFVDSLQYFKNQVFSNDLSGYKIIRRGDIGYPANHVEEGSIGLQELYEQALVSPIYVAFSPKKDEINSFFLHRLLKLDFYRYKVKTATSSSVDRRGSLRWPAFAELTVEVPPIDEQHAISEFLRTIEDEIKLLENEHKKYTLLKKAAMQQLLTGRIRLT